MAPMSLELWSAVASVGTFLVIGATAIAAIVQLRHLRSANQVAAWQMFAQTYEGPELRDAFHFVRTELAQRLEDPEFRRELRAGETDRVKHPEIKICNFLNSGERTTEMALSIDEHLCKSIVGSSLVFGSCSSLSSYCWQIAARVICHSSSLNT